MVEWILWERIAFGLGMGVVLAVMTALIRRHGMVVRATKFFGTLLCFKAVILYVTTTPVLGTWNLVGPERELLAGVCLVFGAYMMASERSRVPSA